MKSDNVTRTIIKNIIGFFVGIIPFIIWVQYMLLFADIPKTIQDIDMKEASAIFCLFVINLLLMISYSCIVIKYNCTTNVGVICCCILVLLLWCPAITNLGFSNVSVNSLEKLEKYIILPNFFLNFSCVLLQLSLLVRGIWSK